MKVAYPRHGLQLSPSASSFSRQRAMTKSERGNASGSESRKLT